MSTNPLLTPSSPVMTPLALRPREAAATIGMSVSSLARLTKAGEIPCIKDGNKVVYRVATLDAWLARRESVEKDNGTA